jgi:hypothetical protein
MRDLLVFQLISWMLLPTVMFGGYSFLVLLPGKLTPRQQTFFRAGHAHAGVLLILSLAYYYYLSLTSLALNMQYLACTVLLGGIILQSGGFFWHTFLDRDGTRRTGIGLTSVGALLLVVAIAILVYALIVAHT